MMDFRDYLALARRLAAGASEADRRSAISRAYYAAFHVARRFLIELGFRVPHADRAHGYLWLRLTNSGEAAVEKAGGELRDLRRDRNAADYDETPSPSQVAVWGALQTAEEIIQALDAAALEPVRTQITDAMKTYERDVLKTVTWQPTP